MSARPVNPAGEAGAALATVVLLALVLMLAGQGILLLGRTQRWITAVDATRWVEDEARRAALASAVRGLDSLPAAGSVATPSGVVEVRELGPELRLLRVVPAPAAPGAGWATLLAGPVPVIRAGDRSGAVRVGGTAFDGGSSRGAGDGDCPPGLDGISMARVGPLPDGASEPRLGILDFEALLSALPPLAGDRLDLPDDGPGVCEEPHGFGDPDRPGSCPSRWGAASRRGDLVLSGRGQGILAVSGDLVVARDARFRGWVWVGGSLRLVPGAELRGLADVGGHLHVEPGAGVVPDECTGARALAGTGLLRAPIPVGPWAWPLLAR